MVIFKNSYSLWSFFIVVYVFHTNFAIKMCTNYCFYSNYNTKPAKNYKKNQITYLGNSIFMVANLLVHSHLPHISLKLDNVKLWQALHCKHASIDNTHIYYLFIKIIKCENTANVNFVSFWAWFFSSVKNINKCIFFLL